MQRRKLQGTNKKIPHELFCTGCDAKNKPIRGEPSKNLIIKGETAVNIVQSMERQRTKDEARKIKEFTVARTKFAYRHDATTQVGKNGSEFHVDRNGRLERTVKINGDLQKEVPVSLRQRIVHMEPYSGNSGQSCVRKMYETTEKEFFWPY